MANSGSVGCFFLCLRHNSNLHPQGQRREVAMSGVNPSDMDKIYKIGQYVIRGDLASIQDGNKVVLGQKLADNLKVKLVIPLTPVSRCKKHQPCGLWNIQYAHRLAEDIAFVSCPLQGISEQRRRCIIVDIKLDDVYQADAVARFFKGTATRQIAGSSFTPRSYAP